MPTLLSISTEKCTLKEGSQVFTFGTWIMGLQVCHRMDGFVYCYILSVNEKLVLEGN